MPTPHLSETSAPTTAAAVAEALVMPPAPKGEPAGERVGERVGRRRGGAPTEGLPPEPRPGRPSGRRFPKLLRRPERIPAPLLCLTAMFLVQTGIAFSKPLFGPLGVSGTTFLRLGFAAVILLAVTRPRLSGRRPRDLAAAGLLGMASAGMTLLFAGAIDRLPMGTAATIEFLGPLAVALYFARRASHLLWALLAAGGVTLLTLLGEGGEGGAGLDPVGLLYAFGAAACYAAYILFTDKVGAAFQGFQGLAVSMTVGALAVAPFGFGEVWDGLSAPDASPLMLLLAVAGVSLLLPVIPYALEMTALRRMPQRVFSVLVSLEPAVSALVGLVVLGQLLGAAQLAGIGCVVAASVGATLTGRR
ncbi:EamA family transporter [Kitasatospora purpeofusca]|uniref:EamA family transporter n=1 Tax=Kitasatospora purpeofusca TaxID=67352 RepID=UPI002A5A5F52|nr:EamA family transporter [Kitasatospora purpeofusca]MDY0811715.1 EamA family transporter [Kitasatospora purpeofusca]